MYKRIKTIFWARNLEYFRDREAFWWNFVFPFLIIAGFSILFQRGIEAEYKFAMIVPEGRVLEGANKSPEAPESLVKMKMARVIVFEDRAEAFDKLAHHKVDLVFEPGEKPLNYWIDPSSPEGKVAESLFIEAFTEPENLARIARKQTVSGLQIHYIDWLFPGVIAMNMMFSALYGVGYVIVRYRKMGVLKRLKATPLTPFEYLTAQILSRMFLLLITNALVYIVCAVIFGFQCRGSYLDLMVVFALGSSANIALGLIVAVRTESEELANGILNLIAWPMMFLSEVWFSLEGAPEWVRMAARLFPLTHVTASMRAIMNDGVSILELGGPIAILCTMTAVFLALGSIMFKWLKA